LLSRTATDFPVPRSPMMSTPPMEGSMTFSSNASFISSWPANRTKGNAAVRRARFTAGTSSAGETAVAAARTAGPLLGLPRLLTGRVQQAQRGSSNPGGWRLAALCICCRTASRGGLRLHTGCCWSCIMLVCILRGGGKRTQSSNTQTRRLLMYKTTAFWRPADCPDARIGKVGL